MAHLPAVRPRRRASLAFVCLALGWGAVATAQTSRASLERRVARHPDDTRALCELGWARFLDDTVDTELAATPLDRAIELLGEPTTPALRNRLAACLYNRGRVSEASGGAGALDRALVRYARSLELRPNEVVARRLAELEARQRLAWRAVRTEPAEPDRRELARLVGEDDPDLVVADDGYVSPDGSTEVVVFRWGSGYFARRARGGPWRVTPVVELVPTNGREQLSLLVGPDVAGAGPTFLVMYDWSYRDCCDEDGLPHWTEQMSRYLVWLEHDQWVVAQVPGEENVAFASDGRVLLGRREAPRARASFRAPGP